MLEGGGKTPILSPAELEEIGFSLVVYPLSLVGVAMRAMEVCILIYIKHMTLFFIICLCYQVSAMSARLLSEIMHMFNLFEHK